jgi:hypothetical protein
VTALGKEVAKMFDGVEFRGKVESIRQVRQRFYYHVTYTDGDEEELTQLELRDGYVLGLSGEIEALWTAHKDKVIDRVVEDTDLFSEGETSEGEGSEFDTRDCESEIKKNKRKRKEGRTRGGNKKQKDLAGVVLPLSGDKTVAGEAYAKLDHAQKKLVSDKVNKNTKKVGLNASL